MSDQNNQGARPKGRLIACDCDECIFRRLPEEEQARRNWAIEQQNDEALNLGILESLRYQEEDESLWYPGGETDNLEALKKQEQEKELEEPVVTPPRESIDYKAQMKALQAEMAMLVLEREQLMCPMEVVIPELVETSLMPTRRRTMLSADEARDQLMRHQQEIDQQTSNPRRQRRRGVSTMRDIREESSGSEQRVTEERDNAEATVDQSCIIQQEGLLYVDLQRAKRYHGPRTPE